MQPRILSERGGRWILNLYPPFLFNRIRIDEIGAGFRMCRVRVGRSLLTRNLNGTTFGGSIFSAADPIYAVMYWQVLARAGERVQVWLRSATIRYLRPATTELRMEFRLEAEEIRTAIETLHREGRFSKSYTTEAVDRQGNVCAVVDTEVFLRVPARDQKAVSAF